MFDHEIYGMTGVPKEEGDEPSAKRANVELGVVPGVPPQFQPLNQVMGLVPPMLPFYQPFPNPSGGLMPTPMPMYPMPAGPPGGMPSYVNPMVPQVNPQYPPFVAPSLEQQDLAYGQQGYPAMGSNMGQQQQQQQQQLGQLQPTAVPLVEKERLVYDDPSISIEEKRAQLPRYRTNPSIPNS